MDTKKLLLGTAVAGVIAAGVALSDAAVAKEGKEKCFGIAKAGENDCAAVDGSHSCAGHAAKDNDPNEWKLVDEGTCADMGGSLEPGHAAEGEHHEHHGDH